MINSWTTEMFEVEKPIIALLHLRPMPGDPFMADGDTIETTVDCAMQELDALQRGGVDGILIANEFSMPYEIHLSPVTIASMGYVIGRLKSIIRIPFGVAAVGNPVATIELAAATGAHFCRATFTGAYVGESGIFNTDSSAALRCKKALGLNKLKLLFKVNPESDAALQDRPIQKVTKSIVYHCRPDGLCVSGASAGSETDSDLLLAVREEANGVPVFCNTGCTASNIKGKLAISDGALVGTALKKDGLIDNFADYDRVAEFMERVREFRAGR